jgi:hypothetical protein
MLLIVDSSITTVRGHAASAALSIDLRQKWVEQEETEDAEQYRVGLAVPDDWNYVWPSSLPFSS